MPESLESMISKAYSPLGISFGSSVTVVDSPSTSAAKSVSLDARASNRRCKWIHTGKSINGLEVARLTALQVDGDGTPSLGPGKLEGLARLGLDARVGELDRAGGGRKRGENNGGVALHFG